MNDATIAAPILRVLPASDHGELPPGFQPLRLKWLETGVVLELTRPEMCAGRHSNCDIHMAHPEISRRHCRFVFCDDSWFVEDRSSLNGVFVNDEVVTRRELRPADCIRIGGFTLIVQPADETAVLRSIANAIPAERRKAS